MTPAERRAALLEWFYADEERSGMTTGEIARKATRLPAAGAFVADAWLYPPSAGMYNRAYSDLCAHAGDSQIKRGQHGGKATWWHA